MKYHYIAFHIPTGAKIVRTIVPEQVHLESSFIVTGNVSTSERFYRLLNHWNRMGVATWKYFA